MLKILGPNRDAPLELLYFNIGLGNLLGGKNLEAATAFKDCIQRFPNGEFKSRAYLDLGRACMMQVQPEKKAEALAAFKMAAADSEHKAEADQWIRQMSESPANP